MFPSVGILHANVLLAVYLVGWDLVTVLLEQRSANYGFQAYVAFLMTACAVLTSTLSKT